MQDSEREPMTPDTSGRTLPPASMRFDLASSSWRTSEATSLWDLEMSSPTFPDWGMTLGGELFELPTPALPTVGRGSGSLPTPTARDWKDMTLLPYHRVDRGGAVQTDLLPRAINSLLPTPTVVDMGANKTPDEWADWTGSMRERHGNGNGHGASLTQEALGLTGSSTPPPSPDGSASSDDPHQPPLFQE